MKILIVDDEPELLNVYESYFKNKGHIVTTAENGSKAWALFEQAHGGFDVILTDHRMPKLNGIELIKKIRQNTYTTPIILVSGDNEATLDKSIADTVFALLLKPTRISELNEIISKIGTTVQTMTEPIAIPTPTPAKSKVLVVDDEPLLRDLICQVLERDSYCTESAEDGIDGFEKWQQAEKTAYPFNLMVVDLKMPRLDGSGLIKAVRNAQSTIPLVVLTGHADLNDAYALLEQYQISDFLSKPLDRTARLLFSVKNALEKYRLSESLQTLNNELEQRIEARTWELKAANEKVELAQKEKAIFLSSMSQELRTPLNAIIGFAQLQELYMDGKNLQELNSSREHILAAGKRLLQLIEDMMDIVKSEKGYLDLQLSNIDLNEIILTALIVVSPDAQKRSIEIIYDTETRIVIAHSRRLRQVLVNLLSNAIKYNKDNGKIYIKIHSIDNHQIEIIIEDTGIGIDPTQHKDIFAPFTHLNYATQTEITGTGIGLALTKFLVEHMNGTIGYTSKLDEGSTFWVRLDTPSSQ